MDRSTAESTAAVESALAAVDDRFVVRRIRARHAGNSHFVDLVVGIPPDAHITQAHATADDIEAAVEAQLPNTDVMVHVEPIEGEGDLRERATVAALSVAEVREVHNVRAMRTDGTYELTLHAKVPGGQSLEEAHDTRRPRGGLDPPGAARAGARAHPHRAAVGDRRRGAPPARQGDRRPRRPSTTLALRHTGAGRWA